MKAILNEYKSCFEIVLDPENMEEQALIIRLGMNATKEVRSFEAEVYENLNVRGYVVLGKRKDSDSNIIKRR